MVIHVNGDRPSYIIEVQSYAAVKVSYSTHYDRIVAVFEGNNMFSITEYQGRRTLYVGAPYRFVNSPYLTHGEKIEEKPP